MGSIFSIAGNRALLSLQTLPSTRNQVLYVIALTVGSTGMAGLVAAITKFIDPITDYDPPSLKKNGLIAWLKPVSTFVFPALVEEIIWRGILTPHPSSVTDGTMTTGVLWGWAMGICLIHVVVHPIAGWTVWPRGKKVFSDLRFLLVATIVLSGTTASYLLSGGSVWCAALTHCIPVALWRDFFGGEAKLMGKVPQPSLVSSSESESDTTTGIGTTTTVTSITTSLSAQLLTMTTNNNQNYDSNNSNSNKSSNEDIDINNNNNNNNTVTPVKRRRSSDQLKE